MRLARRLLTLGALTLGGFALVAVGAIIASGGVTEVGHEVRGIVARVPGSVARWSKVYRSRSFDFADVSHDVDRALRNRDYRLIAINGVFPFFPGLENEAKGVNVVTRRHGWRVIDGTSDVVDSPEQLRFQTAAYEYAKRYNLRLYPRISGK